MKGFRFSHDAEAVFGDLDAMGHVNNVVYLKWIETARIAYWIHVSIDLDAVDPEEAPGVGTPSPGGIGYREMHLALEMLADTERVCSVELVEVNPVLDRANQTAKLGVELLCSLLGKKIL